MHSPRPRFIADDTRRRRARRLTTLVILVVVSLLVSRCTYYDYGVRADHPNVRYPSPHAGTEGDRYQFHTILYRADEPGSGSIEIAVQHLAREPYRRLAESRIIVRYVGASWRVRPGSVRLEHRAPGGTLLAPSRSRSDIGRCPRQATGFCIESFSHFYRPPRSRRLRERIRLEYELDGRVHVIDTTFPLEYRYHYSWWDAMQSI